MNLKWKDGGWRTRICYDESTGKILGSVVTNNDGTAVAIVDGHKIGEYIGYEQAKTAVEVALKEQSNG